MMAGTKRYIARNFLGRKRFKKRRSTKRNNVGDVKRQRYCQKRNFHPCYPLWFRNIIRLRRASQLTRLIKLLAQFRSFECLLDFVSWKTSNNLAEYREIFVKIISSIIGWNGNPENYSDQVSGQIFSSLELRSNAFILGNWFLELVIFEFSVLLF